MNITRDLRNAINDQSMAQDFELISEDPGNFVSDFVDEVNYEFDEAFSFQKRIQKLNQ